MTRILTYKLTILTGLAFVAAAYASPAILTTEAADSLIGQPVFAILTDLGVEYKDLTPAAHPYGKLKALAVGSEDDSTKPWGCIYLKYVAGDMFSMTHEWTESTILHAEVSGLKLRQGNQLLIIGDVDELSCFGPSGHSI